MRRDEDVGTALDRAKSFVEQHLQPIADAIDRDNFMPPDLYRRMGRHGLLGITAPKVYGGSGLGYLAHCMVTEELAKVSPGVALSYGAHSNLCINQLVRHGTEQQKLRYLPKLVAGESIGALAMTEPEAGSDVLGGMQMTAVQDGEHYALNGTKMWITNAALADIVIVYAKTAPGKGSQGITAFLVEKGTPGLQQGAPIDLLGMRCGAVAPLTFTDCKVPAANVLGRVGGGAGVLMSGLDFERVILAAIPVGIMEACLALALPYAVQRRQFGQAIGDFQMVGAKLADMYMWLQASRSYVHHVARQLDAGLVDSKDCASVFLFTSERATQAALHTIQILGGKGYTNTCSAGRYLRDAKLGEIGGGTTEVRRLLIARALLQECRQAWPCVGQVKSNL